MMRRGDCSITWRRKPWKFPGPALPASTKVVVPLCRATSAASTPSEVPPQIYVCVQVDQPGHDQKPTCIGDRGPSVGKIAADRFDPTIGESDIGRLVASACRIYDAT